MTNDLRMLVCNGGSLVVFPFFPFFPFFFVLFVMCLTAIIYPFYPVMGLFLENENEMKMANRSFIVCVIYVFFSHLFSSLYRFPNIGAGIVLLWHVRTAVDRVHSIFNDLNAERTVCRQQSQKVSA